MRCETCWPDGFPAGNVDERKVGALRMHWQEWSIVLGAIVGIVFTIFAMGLPRRRPDRWIYRGEWLIIFVLLVIVFVTISLAMCCRM